MVLSAVKCGLFHLDNILYFSCTFDFTLLIQANTWQIGTLNNVFKVYNGVCSISTENMLPAFPKSFGKTSNKVGGVHMKRFLFSIYYTNASP